MADQPDWIEELNSLYSGGTNFKAPQVPEPDFGGGLIPEKPKMPAPSAQPMTEEEPDWIKDLNTQVKPPPKTTGIPSPTRTTPVIKPPEAKDTWLDELNATVAQKPKYQPYEFKIPEPPKPEPGLISEIGKGVVGGLHDIKSMAGGALAMAGKTVGLQGIEDTGREMMEEAAKSSEPYTPAVGSFRDIKNVGDAAMYLSHGVARMLPNLAITAGLGIITGGVGTAVGVTSKVGQAALTLAGGLAGSFPMEVGQIAKGQVDAGEELDPSKSLWAIPAALLDVLPQTHAIMRMGVLDKLLGTAGRKAVKETAATVPKSLLRRVGKQAGIQFAEESVTEGAQSILERWGAGNYALDKDALDDFVNSFILGGVTGALFGGAMSAIPEKAGVQTKEETRAGVPTIAPEAAPEPGAQQDVKQIWKDYFNKFGIDEKTIDRKTMEDFFSEAMGVVPQAAYDAASLNAKIEIVPRIGAFKQGILQLVDRETKEPILDVTEAPDTGKMEVVSVYENGRQIPIDPNGTYQTTLDLFKDMLSPVKKGGSVDITTSIEGPKSVPIKRISQDLTKEIPGAVEVTKKQGTPPLVPKTEAVPGLSIGSTVQYTRKDGTPGTGIVAEVNQDGSIMIGLKSGGMVQRQPGEINIPRTEEGFGRIAPVFYSQAERTINQKMSGPSSGDQIKTMLIDSGIKQDEITSSGIDEFLNKQEQHTKQDVLNYLNKNKPVATKETIEGGGIPPLISKPELEEPARKGLGRTRRLQIQDVGNYTLNLNNILNKNLIESHAIKDMAELSWVAKEQHNIDIDPAKHFGGYTVKDRSGKWHLYLVTSELKSMDEMWRTAWHEASGHIGIETFFGREGDKFFDRIFDYFLKNDPGRLQSISESYKISPELLENRRRIAREAFAYFAENNPNHSLVTEFIAMVRRLVRTLFPSIALTDSEIISLAMKSRALVTSQETNTNQTPVLYRAYKKPFGKAVSEIVLSKSFQGATQADRIGPRDIQYVARDHVGGDSGRLMVSVHEGGFDIKELEVDPGYRKSDVAERLLINAVMEHGPATAITDQSVRNRASIATAIQRHPEIMGDTKISMATRGYPRSIQAELSDGSDVTMPIYNYSMHPAVKGNVWVRQAPQGSNSNRTLLVQISTNLINKVVDPESKLYYDTLYESGKRPYDRLYDFWEIPQWIAMASKSLPNTDVYVVRDVDEATRFLNDAKYNKIAFSVLDVNKDIIRQIAAGYKGNISVGGYTDLINTFKDMPNVKTYELMQKFIEDHGVEFVEGTDYRHFEGAEVIPRLNLSDGCLHRCTFCAIVPHGKVKQYSETSIRNQVDSIKRLNARLAYINDKTFGQAENSKKLPEIYQELKASNPLFQGFIIQTTAAQFNKFTPEFLRDSGIKYVELGVESYNDSILKKYKKPATEKTIDEAVQKVRDAKLNLIPNIIIGMPEETEATYAKTMDFLRRNADVVSHINAYNLAVYQGTDLADTIGPVTETDMDENSAIKSYHQNPELHRRFSQELFQFSLDQLNTYIPLESPSLPSANFTTFMDPELAEDIIVAGRRIGVPPANLEYIGKQEFPTHYFHLWNVNLPGHPLDGSARSGKNYPIKEEGLGMPRVVMPKGEGAIPGAMPNDESESTNRSGWSLWVEAMKGRDKNFGNKIVKDMGLHEYIWQLPHWVAMKYREFAGVVNVEWDRMDKMNRDRLDLTSDQSSTPNNRVDNKFISMKDVKSIEPLIVYSDAENIFLKDNDLQDKAQDLIGRRLTDEEVAGYNSWKDGFDRAKAYIKTKALQILQTRMLSDPIGAMVWAQQHGDTTNQFANLSPKDQKHFNDLLAEYTDNTEKIKALSDKLDSINFYMPRIREKGDYVVRVYTTNENGQEKAVFADRRASPTAAEELRMQLSNDPRWEGMKIIKTKETVAPEFLFEGLNQAKLEAFLGRAVDRAVRKEGLDPAEAQSVMDSIYDAVTNEILARGFRERYMGRSKEGVIEGYKTTDLKSVFMTYMTGLAGSMNKLEATFNFHQALKGIDKAQQKNLFEYASRYVADMLRNSDQVTRTINKAKTLPYAWYLMANLRMVVAQLFQNYIQGSSVMARYIKELDVKKGGKSGIARTERAMRDVITGNLNEVEKEFMQRAFNEGETMAKLVNELKGRADSGWFKKVTRVIDIMSIPFSKMETINRQTAILAMFRLGLDQGMNNTQAYERAKQFVRDVHYAYGKSNMPQLLRDGTTFAQIGGGVYTFRSFTHNFILSMLHYARDPNGKLALDVIGRTLAWTVLLGGLGAAPFLDDVLDELEKLTGVPYRSKMRSALKGAGGEVLAQAGMSGLPTLLGVDMSGTLKITPSIPLIGSGTSGSLWGVWGGLGQKGLDAVNFTANGQWMRAIESASPTGIEAIGKAIRGSTEGVRGKSNKLVVDEMGRPVYLSPGETARQAVGFRPSRVAELSSERRVEANVEQYFSNQRQDIYSRARTAKTSADWEKVARDVTSFNMKASKYRGFISPISAQTIRASLKLQTKFPKYSQSINTEE